MTTYCCVFCDSQRSVERPAVPPFDLDRIVLPKELRRLATELRNAPHLMARDDLDRVASVLDTLAGEIGYRR